MARPSRRLRPGLDSRPNLPDPAQVAAKLQGMCPLRPKLAVVLGSGFQGVTTRLRVETEVPYEFLPGFPIPGVRGHAGVVLFGYAGSTPLVVLSGRAHYYEGYSLAVVTFPIRVLAALGIQDVLLTNAAGGINRSFRPGDFMVLADHINFMAANPLRGPGSDPLPRFVDLTRVYSPGLSRLLLKAAKSTGARRHRGVYLAVSGPSYETPAEIRAFARLGADAVGMSTVAEAIVARQCGLSVAGLSCITNLAAGRSPRPLSHEEVLATGNRVRETATELLLSFVSLYAES